MFGRMPWGCSRRPHIASLRYHGRRARATRPPGSQVSEQPKDISVRAHSSRPINDRPNNLAQLARDHRIGRKPTFPWLPVAYHASQTTTEPFKQLKPRFLLQLEVSWQTAAIWQISNIGLFQSSSVTNANSSITGAVPECRSGPKTCRPRRTRAFTLAGMRLLGRHHCPSSMPAWGHRVLLQPPPSHAAPTLLLQACK